MLEQLEDLHHVHVSVITLRILDKCSACEPDGDNRDHKEIEHAKDKDDDDILQHRLELTALPDQENGKEEDSDGHGKNHKEDTELVITAADLMNLHMT